MVLLTLFLFFLVLGISTGTHFVSAKLVSYALLGDFGTSFLLKPGEGDIGALQVLLINMRKEIAPFLPTKTSSEKLGDADQCSTVLLHSDNLSLIAHNEDAHVSILDHVYILSLSLSTPPYHHLLHRPETY
jgi:hypothetical protein